MKYLKLNASSEEARKLARCLVGSPIKELTGAYFSDIITKKDAGVRFVVWHIVPDKASIHSEVPLFTEELTLPLDTLKLDPFSAMRERVSVVYQSEDGYCKGHIDTINYNKAGCVFEVLNTQLFKSAYGVQSEITLDLDHYKNIEGIEVVE